jgi:hypothetical protein
MSEVNEIDITSEEIKKPTGNEVEKIAKIDVDGDKPKGEEIPDELKKETAENKEVENYSDSIGDKFMIEVNEHPKSSAAIQAAGELSGMSNEYLQQHIDIRTEIIEKSNQEIGMSQIEKDFGVKFDFDNTKND